VSAEDFVGLARCSQRFAVKRAGGSRQEVHQAILILEGEKCHAITTVRLAGHLKQNDPSFACG
jgi:hypothetical protein